MEARTKRNRRARSSQNKAKRKNCNVLCETKNLRVERGGEPVLKHVTFRLCRGDFLAVLGPNGSGKSTLLNALIGAFPYTGTVEWAPDVKLSYLPEDLSPKKFRELPFNIRDFFRYKGATDEDILDTFRSVGLNASSILKRNPGELSAGQFQRMLIAWSIIEDPEVLFFDEPTLGIDIGGEETIYTLLRKFWEEKGLTIVLVTHEINVVYAYATHVLCLRKEKLFYGKPKEVLTLKHLKELYGPSIKFHVPHD